MSPASQDPAVTASLIDERKHPGDVSTDHPPTSNSKPQQQADYTPKPKLQPKPKSKLKPSAAVSGDPYVYVPIVQTKGRLTRAQTVGCGQWSPFLQRPVARARRTHPHTQAFSGGRQW